MNVTFLMAIHPIVVEAFHSNVNLLVELEEQPGDQQTQ